MRDSPPTIPTIAAPSFDVIEFLVPESEYFVLLWRRNHVHDGFGIFVVLYCVRDCGGVSQRPVVVHRRREGAVRVGLASLFHRQYGTLEFHYRNHLSSLSGTVRRLLAKLLFSCNE